MPRPAPWRLDPAAYPHHDVIQTRFQDLDVLGHINNVAWAALFETARIRFYHVLNGSSPSRARLARPCRNLWISVVHDAICDLGAEA